MPAAGQIIRAIDFTPAAWAEEGTNINLTSDAFTSAGAPLCGVAILAPTSGGGTIQIGVLGDSDNTTPVGAQVGVSVKTGGTLDAGTEVKAPSSSESITVGDAGEPDGSGGVSVDVNGLTPGETYNAVLYHRRAGGAGTGQIFHRTIKWVPDISR